MHLTKIDDCENALTEIIMHYCSWIDG